jgi:uncharacterized membrane protein affecting hemolysin expression
MQDKKKIIEASIYSGRILAHFGQGIKLTLKLSVDMAKELKTTQNFLKFCSAGL